MDCEQRDLSNIFHDPSTDSAKAFRNPLVKPLVGSLNGMDEQDAREHVERCGGWATYRLSEDQGEELLRVMFGESEIDMYDPKPPIEFFDLGNSVIYDFVTYCLSVATRRQPMLSLLAGIVMAANLIGRKLVSSTGANAVVYVVATAVSASGKEGPRATIRSTYTEVGCNEYLGADDVTSDTAMAQEHQAFPCKLSLFDEFNKFAKAIFSPNAGGWLLSVVTFLLKVYSSSQVVGWLAKKYANKDKDIVLYKPHRTLFATGTPELYDELQAGGMQDGFFSRTIFYNEEAPKPPLQRPKRTEHPERLIDWVKAWAAYRPDAGNVSWENGPEPRVIELTPEAEGVYARFQLRCDLLSNSISEAEGASIWGRAAQKAGDFALIHAASQHTPDEDFKIQKRDMEWAIDLIAWLTVRSLKALSSVGQSEREQDIAKIEEFVKAAGRSGVKQSQVTRKFQRMTKRQRDELLADLVESGTVVTDLRSSGGSAGRNSVKFFHKSFGKECERNSAKTQIETN